MKRPLCLAALVLSLTGCRGWTKSYHCAEDVEETVGCQRWDKLPGYSEERHPDGSITSVPVALSRCNRVIDWGCTKIVP